MAQEFLDQLLRIENTVQKDDHEVISCMICLEPYGTLNSSTGAIELAVRLPCNHKHIVGTICVARWLRENNSCPLCRATFFPAQPRPYLEHGIMNAFEGFTNTFTSVNPRVVESRNHTEQTRPHVTPRARDAIIYYNHARIGDRVGDESDPFWICDWLCEDFNLHGEVRDLAQSLTIPISRRLQRLDHTPECIAVLSVYLALFLLNQDNISADFLASLERRSTSVSREHIRSLWRQIYPHRWSIIGPDVLPSLARHHMDGILASLPAPDHEDSIVNREEVGREGRVSDQRESNLTDDDLEEVHRRLLATLEHGDLVDIVWMLAEELDDHMDLQAQLGNYSEELCEFSEAVREVVCVFIACHILGAAITYGDAAHAYNVSEREVRQLYAQVFPRRSHFVYPDVTQTMGHHNLERVFALLPALNWPYP